MAESYRGHLDGYEEAAESSRNFQAIVNLKQHPDYMKCGSETQVALPCLLRESMSYSLALKRGLLDSECFDAMGCSVHGELDELVPPFPFDLSGFSEAALRSMSGNSMHMAVIGMALTYVFGLTDRVT